MLRKIQRVGKRATKFQYTSTYQSVVVECTPKDKWRPSSICVSWTRRGRRLITKLRPWQPSPDNKARGVVIWPEQEIMEIVVTLYKGPKDQSYESKEWDFAVIDQKFVDSLGRMAVAFGHIDAFHPESDSIKAYLERAGLFFTANEVSEDKKVPILLSSIGPSTYSLLSDLLAPDTPSSRSLVEISAALRKHFEPKRAEIAERYHFYKRSQEEGESVIEFTAALRKLATHCNFGEHLDEALHDRLVCGLRQEAIQRRMLSETDLTYKRAMEISLSMEAAERNTKSFKTADTPINQLSSRSSAPVLERSSKLCYRCGRSGHWKGNCNCHICSSLS